MAPACCQGRRLVFKALLQTKKKVCDEWTHAFSISTARSREQPSPPTPTLGRCPGSEANLPQQIWLKPGKVRLFLRSNRRGLPMPEEDPGGTGRAMVGRWQRRRGGPCRHICVEGWGWEDMAGETPGPREAAGPGTALGVPRPRVTPQISG